MGHHLHRQIRDAAVARLTGLATTGARVYASRLAPMGSTNLPGLRVFTDSDSIDPETIHTPHVQAHTLIVVVECCAAAIAGLEDTADQISKEVEVAMASGLTVGAVNLPVTLQASQYDDDLAGTPVGVKRLTFAAEYMSLNNAPDTLI